MTITYPLPTSFFDEFPGWSTEFNLLWRQEQSRTAGGRTVVKDMGSPLWQMTAQSRSMKPNELDYWRARLTSLENGLKTFRAFPKSRCFPVAYPDGAIIGNVVPNPGFENGTSGWTFGSTAALSSDARTGARAAALTKSGGVGFGSSVRIPVIAGNSYSLTAWVKGDVASTSGCYVRAVWFAAATGGTSISYSEGAGNVAMSQSYRQVGGRVTAPATATHVQLQVYHTTGSAAGTMFIDDLDFSSAAVVATIAANRKEISLSSLPAGYIASVGDYIQIGDKDLHMVMEPMTASGSGVTTQFEVRPHLWPGVTAPVAATLVKPSCIMAIVPGSISTTADMATGRGTVTFQAIEAR
ncbi:carbohydrate binding domain-containing protein [Agrobacterium pusense]|uniref:carbohydrate binding domain-containing protein n=1 Tax=Agrobacterium pusense TaxID=648995 RepID=UPI000D1B1835|nr:carbohydrate binding domain-containing protein [Agrobacterium pusense]